MRFRIRVLDNLVWGATRGRRKAKQKTVKVKDVERNKNKKAEILKEKPEKKQKN